MKNKSNSMKYLLVAVIATVFSFICWLFSVLGDGVVVIFCAIIGTIVALAFYFIFLTALIANKCGKQKPSPYSVFAIVDIILMLGTSIYAVYDIMTDVGWFSGLVGWLLLIYVLPCMLAVLIIDGIIYFIVWRKKKNRS